MERERPYSVPELAEYLGIDEETVRVYINDGQFPGAFKLGASEPNGGHPWRIPVADVLDYQERRSKGGQVHGKRRKRITRRKVKDFLSDVPE